MWGMVIHGVSAHISNQSCIIAEDPHPDDNLLMIILIQRSDALKYSETLLDKKGRTAVDTSKLCRARTISAGATDTHQPPTQNYFIMQLKNIFVSWPRVSPARDRRQFEPLAVKTCSKSVSYSE